MAKFERVAAMLIACTLAGSAAAQTATTLVPSPTPSAPPVPVIAPSPVTRPQPVLQSRQNAEAEAVRRSVDERLRRRDAAARRAMQGICKGC